MYRGNYLTDEGISLAKDFTNEDFDELLNDLEDWANDAMYPDQKGVITIYEDDVKCAEYESRWDDEEGFVWDKKETL